MKRLLAIIGIVLGVAWIAPVLAPHDPFATHLLNRLQPPAWFSLGSTEFLLGTDQLGRDVLSRFLHGTRTALLIGLAGGGAVIIIGVFFGLIAGFVGGIVDVLINRIGEIFTSVPTLIFAIAVLGTIGAGVVPLIITIAILNWPGPMRVVRSEVIALREREFVQAATALGASPMRLMFHHLLPSMRGIIAVLLSVHVPAVILLEASLSFLGFGVSAEVLTWGQLLADGRRFITNAGWLVAVPAAGIGLVVMVIVFAGNRFSERR